MSPPRFIDLLDGFVGIRYHTQTFFVVIYTYFKYILR